MSLGVPADLRWEEANNRYLKASLTWLRARLEAVAHSDRASDAPDTKDAPPQTGSARRRRRGRTPEVGGEPREHSYPWVLPQPVTVRRLTFGVARSA